MVARPVPVAVVTYNVLMAPAQIVSHSMLLVLPASVATVLALDVTSVTVPFAKNLWHVLQMMNAVVLKIATLVVRMNSRTATKRRAFVQLILNAVPAL